jgi:spore maturation protein SpmA
MLNYIWLALILIGIGIAVYKDVSGLSASWRCGSAL